AAATAGLVAAREAERAAVAAQREEARQRDEAVRQQGIAEQEAVAEAKAKDEAREAYESMRDVLEHVRRNVFAAGRPEGVRGGRGRHPPPRQAVDEAAPSIARDFAGRPALEARVRHWVGQTYLALGEPTLAAEQLRIVTRLDAAHPPADPADAH